MKRIDQLVEDIDLVARHALASAWLGVTTEARIVRRQVDDEALIHVIDAILVHAERVGFSERERPVILAAERLDRARAHVRKHQQEIRRRLSAA